VRIVPVVEHIYSLYNNEETEETERNNQRFLWDPLGPE
jgi:hypothetical protein